MTQLSFGGSAPFTRSELSSVRTQRATQVKFLFRIEAEWRDWKDIELRQPTPSLHYPAVKLSDVARSRALRSDNGRLTSGVIVVLMGEVDHWTKPNRQRYSSYSQKIPQCRNIYNIEEAAIRNGEISAMSTSSSDLMLQRGKERRFHCSTLSPNRATYQQQSPISVQPIKTRQRDHKAT